MGAKPSNTGQAGPSKGSAFGRKRPPILSRTTKRDEQRPKGNGPIRLKGPAAS